MSFWLVNHSWESFRATREYCGFISEDERNKIKVDDKIVYYGQGLVFGIFEAVALVENEFNGWQKKYPFQVKLKPLLISNNPTKQGIVAKALQGKLYLTKAGGRSSNQVELNEYEFNKIKQAISEGKKAIVFD